MYQSSRKLFAYWYMYWWYYKFIVAVKCIIGRNNLLTIVFASIFLFSLGIISHNAIADTVIATIPVGSEPVEVAFDFNNNEIYVTNFGSDSVNVIDGATNNVIKTITVGNGPNGVTVNPFTNKIYVANTRDDTVSIIQVGTPSQETQGLIDTIKVMNLSQGITQSLDAKLDAAIDSLNAGDNNSAKASFNSFISEVGAQSGKKLTTDQSNQLISAAKNILNFIP